MKPYMGNTCISKMVTFIKIVITRVENGSPDMIPVAFDRKFDEKKDEIPPGVHRLLYTSFLFNIGDLGVDINPKNCHNSGPWGSPMARIWHVP